MTTLQKIRKKVRRLTASPSVLQLPDSEIGEYINTFYEQDMPAALKLWNRGNPAVDKKNKKISGLKPWLLK